MLNPVERFSNRVANYVKYRPGYPKEVISYLSESCGLTADWMVADIGCGTGISSRLLLENGNRVIGVEPNDAMRNAAREQLKDFDGFTVIDGSSTSTGLADDSIDLVVAAQAFHWFERDATKAEFERILRKRGYVVLIWNERQLDTTPFLCEYEKLLLKYADDYERVRHENITEADISAFFERPHRTVIYQNEQVFDLEGIKGRMLSSSYMPTEDDLRFESLTKELEAIFAKHAENGRIRVLYDTRVYSSQY